MNAGRVRDGTGAMTIIQNRTGETVPPVRYNSVIWFAREELIERPDGA